MSPPAAEPEPASEKWFDASIDEAEGLIRLSFDHDTYVRLFSRGELIALIIELRRALELEPGPGHD
jgi:hypothetical protein